MRMRAGMPMPRPTPRATPLLEEELGVYVAVEVGVEVEDVVGVGDVAVVDGEEVGVRVERVDVERVVGREVEVEREVLGGVLVDGGGRRGGKAGGERTRFVRGR